MGEEERNTCTGGWREMAAIFPTGSSREPIAFLERALRRQLWLKNCLCHVRHIFLAFPLFSSPWLQESRDSRVSLSLRFLTIVPVSLPPYSHHLRGIVVVVVVVGRFASLIFFVALLPPHLASSSLLRRPFAASFLFSPPFSFFFFFS